jgi:hypothetical protein
MPGADLSAASRKSLNVDHSDARSGRIWISFIDSSLAFLWLCAQRAASDLRIEQVINRRMELQYGASGARSPALNDDAFDHHEQGIDDGAWEPSLGTDAPVKSIFSRIRHSPIAPL